MGKLLNFFTDSFKASFRRGPVIGVLDLAFRAFALVIWALTVQLLLSFVFDALFVEPVLSKRLWWLAYSTLMFLTVSALAYTAVIDRK